MSATRWRPNVSMVGCPNSFPPWPGETAADYSARLVAEGNAEAWLSERERWVMRQYRDQVAEKFGERFAAQHIRKIEYDADTFFAELAVLDAKEPA